MYTQEETQFYPTPKELAEHIGRKINQREIFSVLEPSAGKGDLLLALDTKYSRAIEVIEADPNLQAILKEKDYPIVGDDFLNFSTYMSYDLILMNPPFKDGDKHLLKAIEIQKNGGQIICILKIIKPEIPLALDGGMNGVRSNYYKLLEKQKSSQISITISPDFCL